MHVVAGLAATLVVAGGAAPVRAQQPVRGRIAATYFSPINTYRKLDATFSVDRDAYVMVGHLGADGTIRVMYPATPQDSAFVKGGTELRTALIDVPEDDSRNSWAVRDVRPRTTAARRDSYDGTGRAYVFLLASDRPLNLSSLSAGDRWDRFALDDYVTTNDPRVLIRQFAGGLLGSALAGVALPDVAVAFARASETQATP
jgi:hypothetical protein